jgi:hypothetical protein
MRAMLFWLAILLSLHSVSATGWFNDTAEPKSEVNTIWHVPRGLDTSGRDCWAFALGNVMRHRYPTEYRTPPAFGTEDCDFSIFNTYGLANPCYSMKYCLEMDDGATLTDIETRGQEVLNAGIGTELYRMANGAHCRHFELIQIPFHQLTRYLNKYGPIIAVKDWYLFSHAVTIYGHNKGTFFIRDPAFDHAPHPSAAQPKSSWRYFGISSDEMYYEGLISTDEHILEDHTETQLIRAYNAWDEYFGHTKDFVAASRTAQISIFLAALVALLSFGHVVVALCITTTLGLYLLQSGVVYVCVLYLGYHFVARVWNRFVIVKADRNHLAVNSAIKDRLRQLRFTSTSTPGAHLRLAEERRTIERECFNIFFDHGYQRVRDVGGSRSRFPEFGNAKHICAGQNGNADVLRDYKATNVFENCRMPGQECPKRDEIRAAILSHVDYYLGIDDLLQVITGPTFIINHRFGPAGTSGTYGDFMSPEGTPDRDGVRPMKKFSESSWSNLNGMIAMSSTDGTPYRHQHHNWQTEGEIVNSKRAATYVRVLSTKNCDVYFAVPAAGTYDRFASTVLTTEDHTPLIIHDGDSDIEVSLNAGKDGNAYSFYRNGTITATVPAYILNAVASSLATTKRDNDFDQHLTSMVAAGLKACDKRLCEHQAICILLTRELCAKQTLRLMRRRRVQGIAPLSDGFLKGYEYELRDYARFILPNLVMQWINRLVNTRAGLKVAKMVGVVHRVAGYEVYVPVANAQLGLHRMKSRFPADPSANHAGTNRGAERRADENRGQRCGVGGAARHQSDNGTFPVSVRGLDTEVRSCAPRVVEPSVELSKYRRHTDPLDPDLAEGPCRNLDGGLPPTPPGSVGKPSCGYGTDASQKQGGPNHGVPRFVNALRAFQPAYADNRVVVRTTEPKEGSGEEPRHTLSVEFSFNGEPQVFNFGLRTALPTADLDSIVALLYQLPDFDIKHVRCVVRWAVRAFGYAMRPCGYDTHPANCFGVRVYKLGSDGTAPAGYRATRIRGVGYAVPVATSCSATLGKGGGIEIRGPDQPGRPSQMLPQVGDICKDDRPTEHQSPQRPIPRDSRPDDQCHRAPVHPRSKEQRRRKSGPSQRPQPKK